LAAFIKITDLKKVKGFQQQIIGFDQTSIFVSKSISTHPLQFKDQADVLEAQAGVSISFMKHGLLASPTG
jgi:hypothetical protein